MSVQQFKRRPTVSSETQWETTAYGAALEAWTSEKEVGKVVKMGTAENYVLAADGDDIEAIVRTVEPGTVNQGFHHGSIQTEDRSLAVVVGATVVVRDEVVAAAQEALGTQTNSNNPPVKKGAGALFHWRGVSIVSGTGAAGSVVVIERVG